MLQPTSRTARTRPNRRARRVAAAGDGSQAAQAQPENAPAVERESRDQIDDEHPQVEAAQEQRDQADDLIRLGVPDQVGQAAQQEIDQRSGNGNQQLLVAGSWRPASVGRHPRRPAGSDASGRCFPASRAAAQCARTWQASETAASSRMARVTIQAPERLRVPPSSGR